MTLRGANLGNWHVIEFWMLSLAGEPGAPKDQFDLEKILTERFGEKEKDRLMDVYRSSWITERDFQNLPKFGFNLVRLPMNYRLMEDDRHPFRLKANAWKWIDRAIDLSEKYGQYVILDMHGAQGGQSPYDHTGHSDQNHLKDSPTDQKRLAWLWGEIAKRYRNRSAVVAYDTLNEPYGMPKETQLSVFRQTYASIRKNDPEKLIFAHGHYDGFAHYGDPKANGWHNVGFQMHYYPGLFGGGNPTVATHMKHLDSLTGVAERVKALDVPFIVGEMNVVFERAGGADMMRKTYDLHAKYGWLTTMWSYKVVSGEGGIGADSWGAATNKLPAQKINFRTASKADIEGYFRHFATEPLVLHEKLREALGNPNHKIGPFPEGPPRRVTAPQGSRTGWEISDIGAPLAGGYAEGADGSFDLFGGGSDVWGESDQFRFLYQPVEGDFQLEVTVDSVEDIDTYTKAGLMVRADLGAQSALHMITTFPSGDVQASQREKTGGTVVGNQAVSGAVKGLRFRIVRRGGKIVSSYAFAGKEWREFATAPDTLPTRVYVGPIALSHDNTQLAKITYRDLKLEK